MLYHSTRGKSPQVSASEAIVSGIAGDGGLFIPEKIPSFAAGEIESLLGKDYREIAVAVSSKFLEDYTKEELLQYFTAGYGPDRFDTPEVAPTNILSDNLAVLELWHGPTCAFKDLPLQILPHLMLAGQSRMGDHSKIVIMVSTSGDTGSAALHGFSNVSGTEIICFYPHGKVSQIQERQMVTQGAPNTHVAAIEGNFDDAQSCVKRIFADNEINAKVHGAGCRLSAANSINWGRLVPQMVYFVDSYLKLVQAGKLKMGQTFNVVIPSGNFGHILAATYVKRMGLPIKRLICASNINHVLSDFIQTGLYDRRREFKTTISPSMDILISSNLERLLYDACGERPEVVSQWMADLRQKGYYQVDPATHSVIAKNIWGGFSTEEETRESIKKTFLKYHYLIDPHTAVGFSALKKYREQTGDNDLAVIASTASAYKFCPSVLDSITDLSKITYNSDLELIPVLEELSGTQAPRGLATLAAKKVVHQRVLNLPEMPEYLLEVLNLS